MTTQFGAVRSRHSAARVMLPTGVAIDSQNRVMVTEQFKGRLQIFRYITDAEAAAEKAQKSASNNVPAPGAEVKP